MRLFASHHRAVFGSVAAFIILFCVWFIGVDESAYYEACSRCDSRHVAVEKRVFGVPVSRRLHSEQQSFSAGIADDLGVPCPHVFVRMLLSRRRGLIWQTDYENIPLSLRPATAPEWYEKNNAAIIARLTAKNPSLPREFLEKVLIQSDREY